MSAQKAPQKGPRRRRVSFCEERKGRVFPWQGKSMIIIDTKETLKIWVSGQDPFLSSSGVRTPSSSWPTSSPPITATWPNPTWWQKPSTTSWAAYPLTKLVQQGGNQSKSSWTHNRGWPTRAAVESIKSPDTTTQSFFFYICKQYSLAASLGKSNVKVMTFKMGHQCTNPCQLEFQKWPSFVLELNSAQWPI